MSIKKYKAKFSTKINNSEPLPAILSLLYILCTYNFDILLVGLRGTKFDYVSLWNEKFRPYLRAWKEIFKEKQISNSFLLFSTHEIPKDLWLQPEGILSDEKGFSF